MGTLWQIVAIILLGTVILAVIGLIGYIGYKIGKFMDEWDQIKFNNDI